MTAETAVETTAAERNARWVQAQWEDGHPERLTFLRYRPVRELTDCLEAAKAGRLDGTPLDEAESILTDALRLAMGHTGGYSTPQGGYEPISYPVTEEEQAKLLSDAADAVRLLRLPGQQQGWMWSSSVDVDAESMTVTVRLRADHPALVRADAAATD